MELIIYLIMLTLGFCAASQSSDIQVLQNIKNVTTLYI